MLFYVQEDARTWRLTEIIPLSTSVLFMFAYPEFPQGSPMRASVFCDGLMKQHPLFTDMAGWNFIPAVSFSNSNLRFSGPHPAQFSCLLIFLVTFLHMYF